MVESKDQSGGDSVARDGNDGWDGEGEEGGALVTLLVCDGGPRTTLTCQKKIYICKKYLYK